MLRTADDNREKKKRKREGEDYETRKHRLRLGGSSTVRYPQKKEELNFEPMLDYKLPNIASGATPIGSAERAPNKDEMINIEDRKG
jgi:hypothetical protein